MKAKIIDIREYSPAFFAGLKAGEYAVSLNGKADFDILDYMYAEGDGRAELSVQDESGAIRRVTLISRDMEPFGISFEHSTIDEPKSCHNNCIFCFMAQMPKGLRPTLYFKDDDYRLSFTQGNYVTLTNVTDEELERIISLKINELNISVHASEEELRVKLMRNKNACDIMSRLNRLKQGGVKFNIQLVLCPGINDGEHLRRTLSDMLTLLPAVSSLACVPVGLTKFRENLYPLRAFTKEEAEEVTALIAEYAKKAREINPETSFCASDEFFVLSKQSFPQSDYYLDYAQYENGVGMSRSFIDEVDELLSEEIYGARGFSAIAVTGVLGEKVVREAFDKINKKFGTNIEVKAVRNEFFGHSVTASGLLCGQDIAGFVGKSEKPVIIPTNMLKDDEDVFLDGMSVKELSALVGEVLMITPNAAGIEEMLRSVKSNG